MNHSYLPMASTPQARLKRDALSGSESRHPSLHILFVHSHAEEVERCLQELNKVHFTVTAEIVVTPEESSERRGSHAYDLVVAECPGPDWRETQPLEFLHLSKRQIPLIFVGRILQRETVAAFIPKGAHAIFWVADVLSFCRDIDTAACYGGDEFAVVLPETGVEGASQVAQHICDSSCI